MKIIRWCQRHLIASIVMLLFVIWGCGKLWPMVAAKIFSASSATHVETIVLAPQAGMERWQAVGTIKAAQDIVMASEVNGIVQVVSAANGQQVKQGDVLLEIRHDDVDANLQKDQAILAQKQLHYQRVQKIMKANAVSQEALGDAYSDFQQAQAVVNADQALLNKYVIKAPFAGVIGIWRVDTGELVRAGDELVTLTQLAPAYVDFMLPAKILSRVKTGDAIQFTSGSYSGRTWKGKVIAIEPQLDNATRSVQLRAQIENADGKLVPRLYGQVMLLKPKEAEIVIPQEAVIYDPEGTSVYVLNKNVPSQQYITLGTRQDNDVVVIKGLKAGDEVVTAGMMNLYPGAAIKVNKQVKQTTTQASS